jgi:hypothetical protein
MDFQESFGVFVAGDGIGGDRSGARTGTEKFGPWCFVYVKAGIYRRCRIMNGSFKVRSTPDPR